MRSRLFNTLASQDASREALLGVADDLSFHLRTVLESQEQLDEQLADKAVELSTAEARLNQVSSEKDYWEDRALKAEAELDHLTKKERP